MPQAKPRRALRKEQYSPINKLVPEREQPFEYVAAGFDARRRGQLGLRLRTTQTVTDRCDRVWTTGRTECWTSNHSGLPSPPVIFTGGLATAMEQLCRKSRRIRLYKTEVASRVVLRIWLFHSHAECHRAAIHETTQVRTQHNALPSLVPNRCAGREFS